MYRANNKALRNAARYFSVGLLAASTVLFAQETDTSTGPAPLPPQTDQQPAPNSGGWKRVGDTSAQVQAPNQGYGTNRYPQFGQNQTGDPNSPPSQSSEPPYNQQPNSNQQNNAPYPPPPPVPASLTIQQGTYITVRVNQMLSSDKNQPGDAFTATLAQPVVVNGVVIAEPGQTLGGRVVNAQKHHFDTPARLGIQLVNMTLVDGQQIPISTQFISRGGGTTPGGQEFGTVAATTGLGATIGAAAGWGTGAAIGAGAGAAAGIIGVLVTHNHASVIYPEQILTFRLEAPVTISTEHGQQAFRYVQPNEYDRPYDNGPGYDANPAQTAAPPPPYYGYPYGYPYPYYAYAYPYWGPSFAFYYGPGFWWGGRWYRSPYYGRGWAVHGYAGGRTFESHGTINGGHVSAGATVHGGAHR